MTKNIDSIVYVKMTNARRLCQFDILAKGNKFLENLCIPVS